MVCNVHIIAHKDSVAVILGLLVPAGVPRTILTTAKMAHVSNGAKEVKGLGLALHTRHCVRCSPQRTRAQRDGSNLWTPVSQRSADVVSKSYNGGLVESKAQEEVIVASQGPQPPSPMMVERFQSVVSQLFLQRIIRLGGAVDDEMANLIVAQLLYLDAVDPQKDITIYVNSPGGSVTAGMAVFDTMRHIRPDVSTVCVGLAASMGAFLLASGQIGKRYSLANSRIMIHQPLGGAQGQAADIEIQANEILHHKLTLNGYLAEFTGQPMEKITADTDRDFFMSPEEAVEYGLLDAVIERPELMAANGARP